MSIIKFINNSVKCFSIVEGENEDIALDTIREFMRENKAVFVKTNRVHYLDRNFFASFFYCFFVNFFKIWNVLAWIWIKEVPLANRCFSHQTCSNQDDFYALPVSSYRRLVTGDWIIEARHVTKHWILIFILIWKLGKIIF